jgi:hypothetical protein
MQRTLILLALGVGANAFLSLSAIAQTPPEVTLTRLDDGTTQAHISQTTIFRHYAYPGVKLQLVTAAISSSTAMITWWILAIHERWRRGPKVSLVDLLAQ